MRITALSTLVAATALAAHAAATQPVDGETARGALFAPRGIAVALSPDLSELQRSIVRTMVSAAERRGQGFQYYGAIAFSPSEGLQSRSLQGAFNFHAPAAADRAALTACGAVRAEGSAGCVIAGRILPQGWEARPVQLSHDATRAFDKVYQGAAPPKAFAISRATGAWAIARGASAAADAVARCNDNAAAKGGPAACETVIAD